MVSWSGIANFGNSALGGYQTADSWMAARQQREMQAAAAKAYGEAMMKMSQPQPWRIPMANDYTPPPPQMTMPNFMQAMPKGVDPTAAGMALDLFAPVMRQQNMDEYRDQQIRLGQDRQQDTSEYRDRQVQLGEERNRQGAQRIDLAQSRIDARTLQNEVANKFRDRALQLQALGLGQRDPQQARAFQATQSRFTRANERVTSLMRMLGDADRNLAMGVRRDVYDARQMELGSALKAAQAELDAVSKELDQYDVSGMGLPQPPNPAQPRAPAPAPQTRATQPPPQAIEILRSRPDTAAAFEQQYGLPPGSARQYLQAPQQQDQMQMSPGGQGGPYEVMPDGKPYRDIATGQPLNVLTGMSLPNKRAIALAPPQNPQDLMNARMLEDRRSADEMYRTMMPGQLASKLPPMGGGMPGGGMPPDAQPTSPPQGESLQPWLANPPPVDAASVPTTRPRDIDTVMKDLMLSVRDEAGTAAGLTGVLGQATGERRREYNAAAGLKHTPLAQRQGNPYIGLTLEQLNGEMKKLSARQFAARTPEEDAAVKRDMDLLFKASAEAAKRGQRGS